MTQTGSTVDRVYLARHGRTAYNAAGVLRGLSDPPLDDVGRAEAGALAAELAPHRPVAVVSSPLQRAVATGRAIADAAGLELTIDERLNDRDYGQWTGTPRVDVERRYGSVDAAPGVEPADRLAARARTAFFDVVAEYRSGPLVLVSHDAFDRALLRELDPTLTELAQPTGCWNRLDFVDDRWQVVAIGRTP